MKSFERFKNFVYQFIKLPNKRNFSFNEMKIIKPKSIKNHEPYEVDNRKGQKVQKKDINSKTAQKSKKYCQRQGNIEHQDISYQKKGLFEP